MRMPHVRLRGDDLRSSSLGHCFKLQTTDASFGKNLYAASAIML